jgi:hypothetical protein
MSTFALLLAEGLCLYKAKDYEGSIEIYNDLISLNRRSLQLKSHRASATSDGGDSTAKDNHDFAEIKVILFRALSRRSEAYLALSKYRSACTDVKEGLALYPHFNNGDDVTTSESGLPPSEIELARDLLNRIYAGVLGLNDHVNLDSLQIIKANHILENPQKSVKFIPGPEGVPNVELQLENKQDDVSVMTPDTCFRSIGPGSTRTMGTERNASQRSRLDGMLNAIDEETLSGGSPISQKHSMTSHQTYEPALPQLFAAANSVSPIANSGPSASTSAVMHLKHPINSTFAIANTSRAVVPKWNDVCIIDKTSSSWLSSQQSTVTGHQIREHDTRHFVGVPTQGMESYLNGAAPNLEAVREFVEEMCNTVGCDKEAIDALKMALIHNNYKPKSQDIADSTSIDLAHYCLTKLLILARESDENKKMMLFDGIDGIDVSPPRVSAFDAIIEAAQIYPRSTKIQQEVCGLLWSLSTKIQEHVALDSGCKTILDAMAMHPEVDTLQVKGLGALKILSYLSVGKSTLRSQGGILVVADAMLKHTCNPAIQSKGCVILGNLAVDESSQPAAPVSEKVVDAVLKGILQHPRSIEVHKAA